MPFFIARLTGSDSIVLSVLVREFESTSNAEAFAQTRYSDDRYFVVEADRVANAARIANQIINDPDAQRARGS